MRIHTHKSQNAFTLVEVMITLAILSILLSSFLILFTPANKILKRSFSTYDINRLVGALQRDLSYLTKYDRTVKQYNTSFQKAFRTIKNSGKNPVFVYQYRASHTGSFVEDDPPLINPKDKSLIPGNDYFIHAVTRTALDKKLLKKELQPGIMDGSVYVVLLRQVVSGTFDNKTVTKVSKLGAIMNSSNLEPVKEFNEFTDPYLIVRAEFFRLDSSIYNYVVSNNWKLNSFVNKDVSPLAVKYFSIKR